MVVRTKDPWAALRYRPDPSLARNRYTSMQRKTDQTNRDGPTHRAERDKGGIQYKDEHTGRDGTQAVTDTGNHRQPWIHDGDDGVTLTETVVTPTETVVTPAETVTLGVPKEEKDERMDQNGPTRAGNHKHINMDR